MSKHCTVLRIGLLGSGTVGSGVAEILHRHQSLITARTGLQLQLVRVCVRNLDKTRSYTHPSVQWTQNPQDITHAQDIDIVVELMGGLEPARTCISDTLSHGKPVVTANKAVLATHGPALWQTAIQHHTDMYFEGAVAGGIPIIRTIREGLAGDRITQIMGILNGTTNFMLDCIQEGHTYANALHEAQQRGYAEADPTLDVNGQDAANKLAILVQLAFGTRVLPKDIFTVGIQHLSPEILADAHHLGYTVKLLASSQRHPHNTFSASVQPTLIPLNHPLAHVHMSQNAIALESDALGRTLYQGAGAGGLPTGSAVVADIIEAARNLRADIHGRVLEHTLQQPPVLLPQEQVACAYYIRLCVADEPGVIASVAQVFAQQGVSLASFLQRDRSKVPIPLVITTHPTSWGNMHKALTALQSLHALFPHTVTLPILPV
jgi:homoserine dehydrogenase